MGLVFWRRKRSCCGVLVLRGFGMLSEVWSDGDKFKANVVLLNKFFMVHQLIMKLFKGDRRGFGV